MTCLKSISRGAVGSAAGALAATLLSLAAACGPGPQAVSEEEVARAREALRPFKVQLKQALLRGMKGGPEEAIGVCGAKAPEIAAALSTGGVRMGRTSHRLRNPANAPEPWMEPLLAAYAEQGDDAPYRAVRLKDGSVGYVEPIHIKGACLTCHGEAMAPPIQARIRELYPEDRATGFRDGDFRGLFWALVPAP